LKVGLKRPRKQYYEVKASKKIYACQVEFTDPQLKGKIFYNLENDLVRFYNNTGIEATDTLLTYITLYDSVGNSVRDTIKLKFDAVKAKEKKAQKLDIKIEPLAGTQFMKNEKVPLEFKFSMPVIAFHVDSLFLKVDDDTLKLSADDFEFDSVQTSLKFKKPLKITENIVIKYKKNTFISVENDTSKVPNEAAYNIKQAENFIILSGIIRTKSPHFILQVINEKNEVEQELVDKTDFLFEYIPTGKKQFRLIIDSNGNGKWDAGSFAKLIPPEKILFFRDERLEKTQANWNYEDIIIEEKEE
jgi:hypothetical protein